MKPADQLEPTEGFIDVPGGRLHYLDWGGDGRHAHFLHGNGFCAGAYAPFIRYLVPRFRILASDIRGQGGSEFSAVERIRHWRIFAEDLNLLIRRLRQPPVIGMGHSLGAVATGIAAASHLDLFSALVLIDPVFLPRRILYRIAALRWLGLAGRTYRAVRARNRRRIFKSKAEALQFFISGRGIFKSWSPDFVQAYLECGLLEKDAQTAVLRCDPEIEAQIFESVPVDVWGYAKRIRCPFLVLRGEHSDVFPADAADRLKRVAADCEVATIAGTGHFPTMEKPKECAEAITEYVQRRLPGNERV
jgi:pimeloyl-ACP methyl ester carboxylesterase